MSRAEGGPFDVEYALFDAHEIELASQNEPGTVREHGYTTTAELARERLDADGVTRALAEGAAEELGALVTAYARGVEVRRVAALLGPSELFEGRVYHARTRTYEGFWLDVAALAGELALEGAARALQALHLASILHDVVPTTPIVMATAEYMRDRRAGERSHRRVSLGVCARVTDAIRELAEKGARAPREGGPARAELLDEVRARKATCAWPESKTKLEMLEKALGVRERPARGPLADAELWAIELQMNEGNAGGVIEKLDALERQRGRQPATAYLRARAQLMAGQDDPSALAEKVSALAMSMSNFAELELLAAETWAKAGDRRRALAYARDLAENPHVDAAVRARARAIVDEGPERPSQVVAEPPPAATSPRASSPSVLPRAEVARSTGRLASAPRAPSAPPPVAMESGPPIQPTPIVSVVPPGSAPPPQRVSDAPKPSSVSGLVAAARAAQEAALGPPSTSEPNEPNVPMPPASSTRLSTRPFEAAPSASRASAAPIAPALSSRPPREPAPSEPDEGPPMKGGSQPPFRTEPPPANFPREPIAPRIDGDRVELVAQLALPSGGQGDALAAGAPPRDATEARLYFTMQARELARLYKQRYGAELRSDLRSVEIVQRHLAERFEERGVQSDEDVAEIRMVGAFLSEILARRLGAEWVDVAPSEIGYWAMNVPPGTRVWPIGRVIRFVSMRHRERDLVSYFLELQARAHGLR